MVDLQLWHIGSDSKPPATMGDLRLVDLPVSLLCFFVGGVVCVDLSITIYQSRQTYPS